MRISNWSSDVCSSDLIKMAEAVLDLTTILDRLAATSRRPRYAMMVLNLLSEAADHRGQAGPFVTRGGETLPVRLWLGETLARMAVRHPRDRKSTSLNSRHQCDSRMPYSA